MLPPLRRVLIAFERLTMDLDKVNHVAKVLTPRGLGWKKHRYQKGKKNSTALGKTLSAGRGRLERVPFNEKT